MTIEDKIKDKELQYHIKRGATEISASSCGKLDK